jgi:hypothetical protein
LLHPDTLELYRGPAQQSLIAVYAVDPLRA